ncbi:MAG: alpha/beta fold hydrolase [SAR324 cluster bacterium]|nr:alpha/beta fold hydrolase [SAR324 cluster bacterium]
MTSGPPRRLDSGPPGGLSAGSVGMISRSSRITGFPEQQAVKRRIGMVARWNLVALSVLLAAAAVGCVRAEGGPRPEPGGQEAREIVVLLHGLGRSKSAMRRLASRLELAGYAVERIGYRSLDVPPAAILRNVAEQIDECCAGGGSTVHFVGHSFGGLLIRAYLEGQRIANLGRVVLIGTPNQGTPLVDHIRGRWWSKYAGETALALGTGPGSFPASLSPPYYPVGIIAGVYEGFDNEEFMPGRDDGLVPVESTKLEGMTDFIVVATSHSRMRSNEDVTRQTLSFLEHGRFTR